MSDESCLVCSATKSYYYKESKVLFQIKLITQPCRGGRNGEKKNQKPMDLIVKSAEECSILALP